MLIKGTGTGVVEAEDGSDERKLAKVHDTASFVAARRWGRGDGENGIISREC